jgi:endonuclease/exonuclease/phosphatase family metal-dependent hydrolase
MAEIIEARTRPDSRYVVVGDMNDPPSSEWLAPLAASSALQLVNGLADAKETRPPKADVPPPPPDGLWTHRFEEGGAPAKYELFDHVWVSPSLADDVQEAWIDRRQSHGGDGSDHDPAWVVVNF